VQDGVGEIDLIPAKVYKLGPPQALRENSTICGSAIH
jgi:hypothetical protein